jgi:signal transduction histidine kinase
MRPLDRLGSIKLKLSAVIVAAVAISAIVSQLGLALGVPVWLRPVISVILALAIVQVFSHGITSPLREMADAARRMAGGDYGARVTATSRDEVGDLARSFNSMAAQLEAVEQQRREFVATVSHDLRTPIAALRANLENIIDGVAVADDESLGQMLRQTERLGRMVSQLLDLSRLESGADPFERTSVPVAVLFADIERELHLTAPDQKLTITVEPDGLCLAGDGDRLHQLLVNLVDNARKVSPADAPIALRAHLQGDEVRLEVEDSGPGVPVDQRDLVFDRFHRVDPARGGSGSGLGLAIARWIADLHDGDIRIADADDGTGCRVVIDLPTHQEPS